MCPYLMCVLHHLFVEKLSVQITAVYLRRRLAKCQVGSRTFCSGVADINGRDWCGALNFESTTQLATTTYCFNLFRGNITGGSRGTSLSSVELPRIIPTKYPRLRIDT